MKYSLYYTDSCPFCHRVMDAVNGMSIGLELRNVQNNASHRKALQNQGGRMMVPCLRIEADGQDQWMYESSDIIRYLSKAA